MLPKRVHLATPADWIHLDLSPEGPSKARRLAEQLIRQAPPGPQPLDSGLKLKVAAALEATVRQAREQRALLAALWSRSIGPPGTIHPVGASVVVATAPLADRVAVLEDDGQADMEAVLREVTAVLARGEQVIEADVVDLPVSPAVRLHKRQSGNVLGSEHETTVLQFFVPIPGYLNMLVMTFSTATPELADQFLDLFDVMAATLRWQA